MDEPMSMRFRPRIECSQRASFCKECVASTPGNDPAEQVLGCQYPRPVRAPRAMNVNSSIGVPLCLHPSLHQRDYEKPLSSGQNSQTNSDRAGAGSEKPAWSCSTYSRTLSTRSNRIIDKPFSPVPHSQSNQANSLPVGCTIICRSVRAWAPH
jgi:hypothetical protein